MSEGRSPLSLNTMSPSVAHFLSLDLLPKTRLNKAARRLSREA
uniref:Uncharacterized protein n=1 Tax=Anguilla anguilla TaxID=7936 RepID=A0A0E9V6C7_ANGAN